MSGIDNFTFDHFNRRLDRIEKILVRILDKEKIIMATEQDLQAITAALAQTAQDEATKLATLNDTITEATQGIEAILAKLSAGSTISDADIQALTALKTTLDGANTTLDSSSANLKTEADKAVAAGQ